MLGLGIPLGVILKMIRYMRLHRIMFMLLVLIVIRPLFRMWIYSVIGIRLTVQSV